MSSLGVEVTLCCAAGGEVGTVPEPPPAAEGVNLRPVRRDSGTGWYVHDRYGPALADAITVLAERVEPRSIATIKERS